MGVPEGGGTMRRYLVVANQTLAGEALLHEIRAAHGAGDCEFHVVVPATPPQDHLTWTEGQARTIAAERLKDALHRFGSIGADTTGEIGDSKVILAILDAIREQPAFDGIIMSTLPVGMSRWLRQDIVHRVERQTGLPVTHVIGQPEPAAAI